LAAHSNFFTEQLQVSVDSHGLVVAPRSEDIQVVVLRDITVDAFVDVLRLIYPLWVELYALDFSTTGRMLSHSSPARPTTLKQPNFTPFQAKRLLQTAVSLGMPGIVNFAMDILSSIHDSASITTYRLAKEFSLPNWQLKAIKQLVYRTRPLSDDEAVILGVLVTAQVARLRELFRSRIFARFEPVVQVDSGEVESRIHQGGAESEAAAMLSAPAIGGGLNLGRCQQAILDALKLVFDMDGPKSMLAGYLIRSEASVMRNMEEWLRLGGMAGGASLCRGCLESVERVAKVYCRTEEMDLKIEKEIELVRQNYWVAGCVTRLVLWTVMYLGTVSPCAKTDIKSFFVPSPITTIAPVGDFIDRFGD
jgi:hypothetical protein